MTQDQFNQMLQNAIAGNVTGYFSSKYTWEEVEKMLDWVKSKM